MTAREFIANRDSPYTLADLAQITTFATNTGVFQLTMRDRIASAMEQSSGPRIVYYDDMYEHQAARPSLPAPVAVPLGELVKDLKQSGSERIMEFVK